MKRNTSGSGVSKRVARTPSVGRPSQLPTDFIALGSKSKPDASGNQHSKSIGLLRIFLFCWSIAIPKELAYMLRGAQLLNKTLFRNAAIPIF